MSSRQQQQQQQPGGPSYNKYGVTPTGPPPPYPQAQGQTTKRFKVQEYISTRNEHYEHIFYRA